MSLSSRLIFPPIWTVLAGTLVLGACASPHPAGMADHPLTPTEQYHAHLVERPDEVALAVHAEGLSAAQGNALSALVARWRAGSPTPFTIRVPDRGDPQATSQMAEAVAVELQAMGVPFQRLRRASYSPDPAGPAPVIAGFSATVAEGPDCSGNWDNLTSTGQNRPSSHFGCATVANFAAMLATPTDLTSPPNLAPGDAVRRQNILAKYREGKVTTSDKDEQATGVVSKAVGP